MVWGLNTDQHKRLILSVGTHQSVRPMSPVDVSRAFETMRQHGATLKDCAELVHLDGTSMVSRFLRLLRLDPVVEPSVGWPNSDGTIVFTAASEIARLHENDHQIAVQTSIEHGFNSAEIKQLVQLRLRSGEELTKCADQIKEMRPRVQKRHLMLGKIDSATVIGVLKNISQPERDLLLKQLLEAIEPDLGRASCHLSSQRFSIVGDQRVFEVVSTLEPDFETAIVNRLESVLSTHG